MTRQEVLSLPNLAIAEVTKFVHLHAAEGYVITEWMEGNDIKEYSGSNCYYMPIKDEYQEFRVITFEEDRRLEALREEAVKAEEEANKEEVNE